jgi:membrane protease YdiL (CAAX protease family)
MNTEITKSLLRVLPFAGVLFILIIRMRQKKLDPLAIDLCKPQPPARYFICTFGFLAYVLLQEVLLSRFGLLQVDKWNHPLLPSIIRITGAVILAPITEELLFRGLLLNRFVKGSGNKHLGIFLQAAMFMILHNVVFENTLTSNIAIAQSLTDGMLFAYARYYSRSIYTPITMHMTGNLIATLERFIL